MKKALYILGFLALFPAFAHASFDVNYKYGSKSEDIKEVQEFLTDQGFYTGPITGNFFSLTKSAVVKFQSSNGISPTSGFWGPLTRAKANIVLAQGLQESNDDEQAQTGTISQPVSQIAPAVVVQNDPTLTQSINELNAKIDAQNKLIADQKQAQLDADAAAERLAAEKAAAPIGYMTLDYPHGDVVLNEFDNTVLITVGTTVDTGQNRNLIVYITTPDGKKLAHVGSSFGKYKYRADYIATSPGMKEFTIEVPAQNLRQVLDINVIQ